MTSVLVDNEWLAMEMPEGFELVPHDELEKLMGFKYDCLWGMRDKARHMLISITWKDANKYLGKLASEKFLANRIDETFTKRYHKKDDYRCDGHFERAVAGSDVGARGISFSYLIEGVPHAGEALVFKRGGRRSYTLIYYTSAAAAAENRSVYEEVLDSLEVR